MCSQSSVFAYADASDASLISRCRVGDEQALAVLIARYASLINGKTARVFVPGLERDDLRQEACMAFLSAVRTYDVNRTVPFSTYAAACIRNRISNVIAASSAQKAQVLNHTVSFDEMDGLPCSDSRLDPQEIVSKQETMNRVVRAIHEELSSYEREVLLAYLNGCSYDGVASKLHSSPKSVDNALQRARRKLKAVLFEL